MLSGCALIIIILDIINQFCDFHLRIYRSLILFFLSPVHSSMRTAVLAYVIALCLLTTNSSVGVYASKMSHKRLMKFARKHIECCRRQGCSYTIVEHLNKCEPLIFGYTCMCSKWTIKGNTHQIIKECFKTDFIHQTSLLQIVLNVLINKDVKCFWSCQYFYNGSRLWRHNLLIKYAKLK